MGCGGSKELNQVYPEDWVNVFEALQLRLEEIVEFEKIFQEIDDSADGKLDLMELLDYIGLKSSSFARRVFSIFDGDGNGQIDFKEFVLALWNFCACSDSALRIFAFDLYDDDTSGKIEVEEVEHMLRDVYGAEFESSPHASRLMKKMRVISGGQRRWDGEISLEQFAAFSKNNPAMLYPAFKVQRKIQTKIMGVKFWDKVLDRRILVIEEGSHYVSVKDILNAKISESAFKDLMERSLEKEAEQMDALSSFDVHPHFVDALDHSGIRATRNAKQGSRAVKSILSLKRR